MNENNGVKNKQWGAVQYDPASNVASITDISNTALSYAYDATGRLVSAIDSASNGFGSLGYSYDKNGNRTVETRNASNLSYVYSPPNWLYQKAARPVPEPPTATPPVPALPASLMMGSTASPPARPRRRPPPTPTTPSASGSRRSTRTAWPPASTTA